jgi:dihydroxyacetone kinase-like predicted kinase
MIPQKFEVEFTLHTHELSNQVIKSSLSEFGDNLSIIDCQDSEAKGRNIKVFISTEDPTVIFDVCAQFGRIKSVKIDEKGRQRNA